MDTSDNLDRPPTMRDIIALLGNTATKQDITEIKNQISAYHDEHSAKISKIEAELTDVVSIISENSDKINELECTIEMLKQDKLKNNVCISGMPSGWDGNSTNFIMAMGTKLGLELVESNFNSYTTFNGKFIVASFYNFADKERLLGKMRIKKSLMAEEIVPNLRSNNRININEHLTPFNSGLFAMARRAKHEGKLATATSYGGRIRVKKHAEDMPVIIHSKTQLESIIELVIEPNSPTHSRNAPREKTSRHNHATNTPTEADDNTASSNNTRSKSNKKHTERSASHKRLLTSPVLTDLNLAKKNRQDRNNNNISNGSKRK